MNPPDDPSLLRAAAAGDCDAFETFVGRHQASVYRLARAMTADADEAEDVLQETFLAAWKSAGSFRGSGSARAWILTIARNAVRRSRRRRAGEPAHFEPVDELGLRAGWGGEEPLLDTLARRDLLRRALDSLSPEDREVLVLRELEGLGGEEVAGMLGLSLAAMKSRLHRARLRLVAALKEVADA